MRESLSMTKTDGPVMCKHWYVTDNCSQGNTVGGKKSAQVSGKLVKKKSDLNLTMPEIKGRWV